MAGRGNKGRSCRFESLENRNLLAGDVTASIRNGDLIIKGDDLANGIQITAGTTAGTVKITGINAGGTATNINGSSNGSVTLSGFNGDIKIKLKGGDDSLSMTDLDVPGKLKIEAGEGNDSVTLDGVTVDRKFKAKLSDGNDSLSITNTTVAGSTKIKGKDGEDEVTIEGSTFSKLRVSLGDDDDTLDISGSEATRKTRFNGGRGTDTLNNDDKNDFTNFKEKNFEEEDDTPSVNAPTLALSGASTANEGAVYTLNLASSNSDSAITKWTINWGDGSTVQTVTGNPSSVTHTFADGAGTRTISATATNSSGTFNAGNTVAVAVANVAPTLAISGASTVNEGAVYTLNLASSDPGADTITKWTINWGDGSAVQTVNGNPTSVTHTFADGPGTRTISATATDEDGTFNAGNTVTVTVGNVAPTLAISGASTVNEGAVYTLNLASTDPGTDTITKWTINWGDGSAVQTVTGNPSSVTHTFADGNVSRTISATATDEDGTFNAGNTVTVTVNNVAPALTLSGASSVNEGAVYTLNLASSDPGTDTITQWTINWGDGSAAQTVTGNPSSVTHTYTEGSLNRTISATATDEDGTHNAGNTVTVTVNNVAPTLTISGASSVSEGAVYTLNLASSDPGTDTITQWTVNWGDGSAVQTVTGNPSSVTHTFTDGPNSYTISATATDEDGTFNAGNTVAVTVTNLPPSASITGPTVVTEGVSGTWTLALTGNPGADTITTYIVRWGDGQTSNISAAQLLADSGQVTHAYAAGPNDYTILVDLVDEDSTHLGVATLAVSVDNATPVLSLVAPTDIEENQLATLTGSYSDSGVTDSHLLQVSWDDANSPNISSFSIPALQNAAGTATLEVSDTFNSTTDSAVLTITAINAGVVSFSVQHRYLDDGVAPGNNLATDTPVIEVLLEDDFNDSDVKSVSITVNNIAPQLAAPAEATANDEGTATLILTVTDQGTRDVFSVDVNWLDGVSFTITGLGLQDIALQQVPNESSSSYSWNATTRQLTLLHTYATEGSDTETFLASFTAHDDDLGTSSTQQTTITVNVSPQVT